ncbi:MAG: OB-fold nucleic acid binding domain-containing protein [Candidatus Woesearchaeota archaeon]
MVELIRIPYADIVEKIKSKTGMSEEEIRHLVEEKQRQLSGLISKDGAAHIVANELGVKLFEHGSRLKIKELYPEMRAIETVGKVLQVFLPKQFVRADNTFGNVGSFTLGDETGHIRVVCWGKNAEAMAGLKVGDVVRIISGYVRENRGLREVHLNDNSSLIINPEGIDITEVKQPAAAIKKAIKELSDGDENIEITGTVIQVFDLKFFESCPDCGKRLKQEGSEWFCRLHKRVEPTYSPVLNLILDDGTDSIRVVLFRNQVERLLDKSTQDVLAYKGSPESFSDFKTALLGEVLRLIGRVKRNEFFDRLEFTAQRVFKIQPGQEEVKAEVQPAETERTEFKPEELEFTSAEHWSLDNSAQNI